MIEPSKYYPRQMNGPVISAFAEGNENEFQNANEIAEYLYNLSIATAEETELENIGRIIGFLRPLVPEGFNNENIMLIGSLPLAYDEINGLATVGSETGGELASLQESDTYFMDLGTYRKFLEKMAILKRYGLTLQSIAKIAEIIDPEFELSWDENQDIVVHYNKDIGYKNIWILTQIFYKVATEPQVLITAGLEEV